MPTLKEMNSHMWACGPKPTPPHRPACSLAVGFFSSLPEDAEQVSQCSRLEGSWARWARPDQERGEPPLDSPGTTASTGACCLIRRNERPKATAWIRAAVQKGKVPCTS